MHLYELITVSAVVMGISHTITRERICARLRQRLGGKETFLGYLFSCPYCASHWVAFAIVPLTGVYYVDVDVRWPWLAAFLRWFLSCILVTVVAAFLRVVFYFVDESQGLLRRREKEVDEARAHAAKNGHARARSSSP